MRRAVVGAVLALVISACGGTRSRPRRPRRRQPHGHHYRSGIPTIEPPAPSIAPSPAVSEPPVATAWRKLEPGDGPPPEKTTRGRSIRPREPDICSVAATARRSTTTSGRSTSRLTPGGLDPGGQGPAARFGHEAVWVDGVGLVVWAGQAGPTAFFDDLWAFDPAANDWSHLPNDGPIPSRAMARVRRSARTGGYGSATGSRPRVCGSPIRARTIRCRPVDQRNPRWRASPSCAACTRAG